MQKFFTDSEFNVSFPDWFNDSIIRERNISKLTRVLYKVNDDDEETEETKEIKTYEFNRNGEMTRYEIQQFYDHQRIGHMVFTYKEPKDQYGYSKAITDPSSILDDEESYFQIYSKEQYSDNFLVYLNEEKGNYMFYILNKRYWGGISVDTIANPTPQDIIIYGSPGKPEKRFQVKNKVNEFNLTETTYNRKYGFVETINFDKYPFRNKRTFKYKKNGNFEAFIDSTFSGDQFLNRSVSTMYFDKTNLPERLHHEFFKNGQRGGYNEIDRFTYEYYQD